MAVECEVLRKLARPGMAFPSSVKGVSKGGERILLQRRVPVFQERVLEGTDDMAVNHTQNLGEQVHLSQLQFCVIGSMHCCLVRIILAMAAQKSASLPLQLQK